MQYDINMDRDSASMKIDQFITETGYITTNMVGVILQIINRTNTQDSLLMIGIMEKEQYNTMMAPILKGIFKMGTNKAKDVLFMLMAK